MSDSSSTGTSTSASSSISRRLCPLCGQPGTKVCAGCSKVGYCSKEHQRDHWKEHKLVCAQKHKLLGPSAPSSGSSLSSASRPDEVTVTWSDQQSINTFSRLNTQLQVIEDDIQSLDRDYANIVDAVDTIETLIDDDSVMIKIGEVFVPVTNEEAEEWVKKEKKQQTSKKEKLTADKQHIEGKMKELKTVLYGKFGKAINLENAEQTINDK